MNCKTAKHLNYLLKRAEPVTVNEEALLSGGMKEIRRQLCNKASELAMRDYEEQVTFREIVDAAIERRPADVNAPTANGTRCDAHDRNVIPWPHTRRIHLAAIDAIRCMVATDNAKREAEYEAYRLACEQGTARPPAE